MLWLYFSLLFDGLVLFLLFQFADYPLEKPMIGVSALNPIDLGRILILLQMDVSAMMGYTGAVFKDFFGTYTGVIFSFGVMLLWIVVPVWFSTRKFNRKDLIKSIYEKTLIIGDLIARASWRTYIGTTT